MPNGNGPREMFVTKPFIKLKKLLGYSGMTIQAAAENLDHIQFFTIKKLKQLAQNNGFKIIKIKNSNIIDDVFPFSIITRKLLFIQKLDSLISDILPTSFTGRYLMIWIKHNFPHDYPPNNI